MTLGPGGVLYGATANGGSDIKSVFSLTPPASPGGFWTYAVYVLPYYSQSLGQVATVTPGTSALYGTTSEGGSSGFGSVFSLTPRGSGGASLLYSFTGTTSGFQPKVALTIGPGGVMYGTTYLGGANNCGVVYSLTPPAAEGSPWTQAVIYQVTTNDGCGQLDSAVIIDSNGVLYVADESGGANHVGRIFSLTPSATAGGAWSRQVVYNFRAETDGAYPVGLTFGAGGVLYGAANAGGMHGYGSVFSLTPPSSAGGAWTETTLYNFAGGTDGNAPFTGVVIGPGGVLYGTTSHAAQVGKGNVYSLTPPASPGGSWTEVSLHNFTNGSDGGNPSGLVIHSTGLLYGATLYGGSAGYGTIYSLQP